MNFNLLPKTREDAPPAGRIGDAHAKARHSAILRNFIQTSVYPEIAEEELARRLGESRAAVLNLAS
jgi:hypothetical protein